jgi:prepilin-type N-terminal cleavage/methylation domain-containing protein
VTLIEMMVALVVLGLLTGMAAATLASLKPPAVAAWRTEVTRARESSIRTGRPVLARADSGYRALLLPDGRAIGPGLDPLTGEVIHAPR